MPPYTIVLADDHSRVRRGIKKILQQDDGMRVVGEATDGLELLEILRDITPNLVILDITMPRLNGLEAAKRICRLYPVIKVLVLSMHRSKEYLDQALAAGVHGYLVKDEADVALLTAIDTVRRGQTFLSPCLCHNQ